MRQLCTSVNIGARTFGSFEQLNKKCIRAAPSMFNILNTACFLDIRIIYLSWLHIADSVDIWLKRAICIHNNYLTLTRISLSEPKANSEKRKPLFFGVGGGLNVACGHTQVSKPLNRPFSEL